MTDPRQTAQDLRAAAQAVTTYGHAREAYIDSRGRLCAAGAIGVTTGYMRRIQDATSQVWDFAHSVYPIGSDPSGPRYKAALDALAPLLPTVVATDSKCVFCTASGPDVISDHRKILLGSSKERVFHYNDFICEGGEELATLLVQAAEKLEADLP